MLERRGVAGVGGRLDGAVGGVLEADRHRQAAGQLAVHLAFRVPRADRPPADQVAQVLRGDRVQPFDGGGQAHRQHIGQHLARQPHALADVEPAVEIGIVDQPLPSDRGARLLEIRAHDDDQTVIELPVHGGEPFGVLVRRLRIMDRTGAHDRQQAVVPAVQHVTDLLTGAQHQIAHLVGQRQLTQERTRRRDRIQLADVDVDRLGKDGALIQTMLVLGTVRTTQTRHPSPLFIMAMRRTAYGHTEHPTIIDGPGIRKPADCIVGCNRRVITARLGSWKSRLGPSRFEIRPKRPSDPRRAGRWRALQGPSGTPRGACSWARPPRRRTR